MGLSLSLTNALGGMKVTQTGLEVLSRNVANAGTPGYHRQSLNITDYYGTSAGARTSAVSRAFSQTLQDQFTRALADNGQASVAATFLDRWQTYMGMPGAAGSLDTVYGQFYRAMETMVTKPDDFAARAQVVTNAQALVETLNRLTSNLQVLRQEAEGEIATNVSELNRLLGSAQHINVRLAEVDTDPSTRASLMDERDRLVAQISEIVDVRVDYRADDTVALSTRSGLGLLDYNASVFEFRSAGGIDATSLYSPVAGENGVGVLNVLTPAGLRLDLVEQDLLQSGRLAGLLKLRDDILVEAQGQLDDIAAALALNLNTVVTPGTPAASGAQTGLAIDISDVEAGNDLTLTYVEGGVSKTVRLVRVDDPQARPLDATNSNGVRTIGIDFTHGAADVAAQIQAALGSNLAVSGSGSSVTVLAGTSGLAEVKALSANTTVNGVQGGPGLLSLSMFVDAGNSDFTNSLDGKGQRLGFAGRIALNSAVLLDNRVLVQHTAGDPLGNSDRAEFLKDRLDRMAYVSDKASSLQSGNFRLSGNVSQLVAQMINYQGNSVATALKVQGTTGLTMETLNTRMEADYGVNIDEEMARLMELQNAYAAGARVISVVQELIDRLMNI